jgi:hypothetical protein
MFDQEFREKCLIYFVGVLLLVAAGWGAVSALTAFRDLILVPTYHFILDYWKLYGLVTVEVVLAFTTIVVGGVTHRRVVKQLTQSFDSEMEHSRMVDRISRQKFEENKKAHEELIRNEGALKENLRLKQREIGALQNRITELETEIERLKNPLAVAAREASIARLEGESEIMDGVKDARNRYEY